MRKILTFAAAGFAIGIAPAERTKIDGAVEGRPLGASARWLSTVRRALKPPRKSKAQYPDVKSPWHIGYRRRFRSLRLRPTSPDASRAISARRCICGRTTST